LGADPVAVSLALNGANLNSSIAEDARAFLREQRRMLRLQIESLETREPHLREEEHLRLVQHRLETSHMRVRRLGDYARMAFDAGIGLVLLAIATGIGIMVWNAARAEGLIIESFSVPPSLVEKGLTGQVVASRLEGRLSWIANLTAAVRPPTSYAHNWDNDLKVEIPDTGISIGEAYRFLRAWLGHETHLSGDIVRTPTGIVLSIRTTGGVTASIAGTEDRLDDMVLKIAESVILQTEPSRYARYLFIPRPGSPQRFATANAILLQDIANKTDIVEKSWSIAALSGLNAWVLDYRTASTNFRNALAINPEMTTSHSNFALIEVQLSHPETALAETQAAHALFGRDPVPQVRPSAVRRSAAQNQMLAAVLQGDFAAALATASAEPKIASSSTFVENVLDLWAQAVAQSHDAAAARTFWRDKPAAMFETEKVPRALSALRIEAELGHWPAVVASAPAAEKAFAALHDASPQTVREIQFRPMLALAKARLGDIAGAQALIAATPGDCYDCIRTRALIAEAAKQPGRVDYWFARSVAMAPSIPFAYSNWGDALLMRGDAEGAIEKFKLANQKGPHFADPLEGWGEALMAKNQSHLALAKFAEAEKLAPNWGRLYLKWGEALYYTGKKDEAKAQFARAARLDLTPAEKDELGRQTASIH